MLSVPQFNSNFDGDIRLNLASNFDVVSNSTQKFVSALTSTNYTVSYSLINQPSSYSDSLIDTRSKIN